MASLAQTSLKQTKRRWTLWVRRRFFHWMLSGWRRRLLDRNSSRFNLGELGEREAERFFLKNGYWIVERGFGEKTGEIDLIVTQGDTIVFVEVKTRAGDLKGTPEEAVDELKQQHISQTARLYLVRNGLEDCPVRFDVISIVWSDREQTPALTHFQSAFEATGEFQLF